MRLFPSNTRLLGAWYRKTSCLRGKLGLRNRAPFPQEYPSLELTLTDERDELVVRRVLAPADYLADRRGATRGLAAGGEEALRLYFEAAKVRATGYRLYLFFP